MKKFVFLFLLMLVSLPLMAVTGQEFDPGAPYDPLQLVSLLSPLIVWGAVEVSKKLLIITPVWILVMLVPILSGIATYLLSLIVPDLNFILTFVLGFAATFIDQVKKYLQAFSDPNPT